MCIGLLLIGHPSPAQPLAADTLQAGAPPPGLLALPAGAMDTTSLNFKDTDLRDVFRAIAYQHGLNLFLDNSVNKRTTIALNRVRVYDAIGFLAQHNGLIVDLDGGIFRIYPPPPPPQPKPPPPREPLVRFENHLLSVQLKNDDIEKVILEIQRRSGRNILLISGTTGTLTGMLVDVEFDNGFTQLLNNNGFSVQKRNGIYLVSRLDYFVGTQGVQAQQKTGPYWVSVKDSLVSIDVTSAPLERLLHDMIRQLNTDVVFYNQITGSVTARATGVPLARALDLVLRNTNYSYREGDGIYFVGDRTSKALISTRLLRLKYLRADVLMEQLPQSITSQATIKVSREHNGFIVIATSDVFEQLRDYMTQIDRPVAQVLLEALVVDFDVTKGSEFGVQAGLAGAKDSSAYTRRGVLFPGIDMQFNGVAVNRMLRKAASVDLFGKTIDLANLGKLPADFYLRLKALETEGIANVKSRPIIATLNGHKASLTVGTTQYYLLKTTVPYRDQSQVYFQESQSFQTIEADVKLEITPYVGVDGQITVDIKPDFRTPVGQLAPDLPPTINKRSMSSTLVVRDGETIILGGLVQESESESSDKVPILGSIPLLGKLFSSSSSTKRKVELLIYVTPHVSYGEAFNTAYASPPED